MNVKNHLFSKNKLAILIIIFILLILPITVLAVLKSTNIIPRAIDLKPPPNINCRKGINSKSVFNPCQNSTFHGVNYSCYDNSNGTFESTNCRSPEEFFIIAQQACDRLSDIICLPSNDFGKALNLDGVSTCIEISTPSAQLNIASSSATTTFTIEGWFNLKNDTVATYNLISSEIYNMYSPAFLIQINNQHLEFTLNTHSGANTNEYQRLFGTIVGTTTINPYLWYHFAAERDGNKINLYLNGKQDAETVELNSIPGLSLDTKIDLGCLAGVNTQYGNPPSSYFFPGLMEEFRISNSIRYFSSFIPSNTPFILDDNTIALWRFNDNLNDEVNYHNNGLGFGRIDFINSNVGYISATPILTPIPSPIPVTPTPTPIPTSIPSIPTPNYQNKADLDVTYIERQPRYFTYNVNYSSYGVIALKTCPNGNTNPKQDKRWPSSGERVSFIAHIINKANRVSAATTAKWYLDDKEMLTQNLGPIIPGQETTLVYSYIWQGLADHTLKIILDPDNKIDELTKKNNTLTEYTNSLNFLVFVEQKFKEEFEKYENLKGSYSFEDWFQTQLDQLKELFTEAKYSLTPSGVKERIRLDKVIVIPFNQNDPLNYKTYLNSNNYLCLYDGRWQFIASQEDFPTPEKKITYYQKYVTDHIQSVDYGLLHELMHQLGVIDEYRFGIPNDPDNHSRIYVKDKNGNYAIPPWPGKCPGLMAGEMAYPFCDGKHLEDRSAYALNLSLHKRRGYFGEYLLDIPKNISLRIMDKNNQPVINAKVALYQKARNTEIIDDTPEHDKVTDQNGIVKLDNKPVTAFTTETGHTSRPNPFGQIGPAGENGTFLVKITYGDQEDFQWLTIRPFNFAYWQFPNLRYNYTLDFKTNLSK